MDHTSVVKKASRASTLGPRNRSSTMLKQDRSVEARRQILLAAGALFRDKGYKATTLRDIAKTAGTGAANIYYYFHSKEQLLREVTTAGISSIDAAVRGSVGALPEGSGSVDRLRCAIRSHLQALLETGECPTNYARIYSQLPSTIRRRDQPKRLQYVAYWRGLVREAQQAGEIRAELPAETFIDFLLGAMSRAIEWYDSSAAGIDELADRICDWVLHGIAGDPGRRESRTARIRR